MMKFFQSALIFSFLIIANTVCAESYWKTGNIEYTWSDQVHYSGCMVKLSVPTGDNCPANNLISLDCMGKVHGDSENSKRLFADAMAAMHAGKTVSLYIDDTKKVNGYCVARVIRVFK